VARTTPRLIDRGDLLAALDRASARKVTIISAPAGSGKTSLLRAWADRPGQRHRLAVVQVHRDQHDAQDFWLALLGAVRHASGTTSGAEPPAATLEFNAQTMADRVLAELAAHRGRLILVIDDLHELNAPGALTQLTRLLTDLPPDVHAVLATRRDLRLRLHQLRLAGELAEIRAAELRFTERETRELLAASGIALSEAGTALLHQRTEGWAAGLRLAALSMAGHPDPERFVQEFSGTSRTVAEYLLAEMLERQPGEVQDLLLRTSLLDRVNAELADLLTGRPGSERILLELEDANAFVVSLDPERTWFRYHHLFADLLQLELRRTQPAELAPLHGAAAGWFAAHGYPVEAIRHTQAAQDWNQAARLLSEYFLGLVMDGQGATAHELLAGFPADLVAADPELVVLMAIDELFRRSLTAAERYLARAKQEMTSVPADRREGFQVNLAIMRLMLAQRRGDLTAVIEEAQRLLAPDGSAEGALPRGARTCARWRWSTSAPPKCGRSAPARRSGTWSKAPSWPVRSGGPGSRSAPWPAGGGPRASGRSGLRASATGRRSSWPRSTAGPMSRSWPPPTRGSVPSGSGKCVWRRPRACSSRPTVRNAATWSRLPGSCFTRPAGCSSLRAAATARRCSPSRPPNR